MVWQDGPLQVIGVVPDTVYLRSTEREPRPFFYQPLSQNYENARVAPYPHDWRSTVAARCRP